MLHQWFQDCTNHNNLFNIPAIHQSGYRTSTQRICGCISLTATLKFTFFLFNLRNVLLKIISQLISLTIHLFRTTVRISNKETACTHEASDNRFYCFKGSTDYVKHYQLAYKKELEEANKNRK